MFRFPTDFLVKKAIIILNSGYNDNDDDDDNDDNDDGNDNIDDVL